MSTETWVPHAGGDWSKAASWLGFKVPTVSDDAFIRDTATATVDAVAVANSLTLEASGLTVSGTLALGAALVFDGGDNRLELQGGSLGAASIMAAGSTRSDLITGHGAIVLRQGIALASGQHLDIEADQGTLKVDVSADSGAGLLSYGIQMGATLELSHGTSSVVHFQQSGVVDGMYREQATTLRLDAPNDFWSPAGFNGNIANLSIGDRIDLRGITVRSANINTPGWLTESEVVVNELNGSQLTFTYVGHSASSAGISGASVLWGPDGEGGTLLYFAAPAARQATTVQQEIAGLYAALYGRTADHAGMQYWVSRVAQEADAAGLTAASAAGTAVSARDAALVGQLFATTQSHSFDQTFGTLSDAQFVDALYLSLGGQRAETATALNYWVGVIHAGQASGLSVQAARGAMAGQLVHDMIDVNLAQWAPVLAPDAMQTAVLRQAALANRMAVSLAYADASSRSDGAFLNAQAVGDAAFVAQTTALAAMVANPLGASVQTASIHQAVAGHDLGAIELVGVQLAALMGT